MDTRQQEGANAPVRSPKKTSPEDLAARVAHCVTDPQADGSRIPEYRRRQNVQTQLALAYTDFLRAAAGVARTMVLAGFALTICILPKISRLPALVAALRRVFSMAMPGMLILPVFLISLPAISASTWSMLTHCLRLSSVPM